MGQFTKLTDDHMIITIHSQDEIVKDVYIYYVVVK